MTRELGDRMVADERFKLLTFTGSPSVGWRMKERAGKKKVVLELGGNAGVIVDETADLDWAVGATLVGAFGYAGQVCISVQRMFVHEAVWDEFMERFVAGATDAQGRRSARPGRPISGRWSTRSRPRRTQRWVDEAVALGGKVLARRPGRRHVLPADRADRRADDRPGLLATRPSRRSWSPSRSPTSTTRSREVNDSIFGLQTGVFTNDLAARWRAFDELEVGGVIVNDIPTYRIDHMPYGGVKDSGLGREGLRWAIEDMTEIRIMVIGAAGVGRALADRAVQSAIGSQSVKGSTTRVPSPSVTRSHP